ncbi:MAG: carboxypeptidase regulatory-like domain-containing protein [Acidobacteriota bacterium]
MKRIPYPSSVPLVVLVVFLTLIAGPALALPEVASPVEELPEPESPGTITGFAYGGANSSELPWGAPVAALLVEVQDGEGDVVAKAVTDGDGAYSVSGLKEGSYLVSATESESGASGAYGVDVAGGTATVLNFVFDERRDSPVIGVPAARLLRRGEANPDPMENGVVDLEDLVFVRSEMGAKADAGRRDADLDDNGRVDHADLALVHSSFGQVLLNAETTFAADVAPGGSTCQVAGGIAIQSQSGHTTGTLKAMEGGVVRFEVIDDSGTATSPQIGGLVFDDDPDAPSYVDISLADGRILGGEVGLAVTFDADPDSTYIGRGSVSEGYVAFRPGGFGGYRLASVSGELQVGSVRVAYACDEDNDPKEDKACETKQVPRGSAQCSLGGTACKTNGAACAKNGGCKTCHDSTVTYYHPNNPNRPIGTKCTGCSCF